MLDSPTIPFLRSMGTEEGAYSLVNRIACFRRSKRRLLPFSSICCLAEALPEVRFQRRQSNLSLRRFVNRVATVAPIKKLKPGPASGQARFLEIHFVESAAITKALHDRDCSPKRAAEISQGDAPPGRIEHGQQSHACQIRKIMARLRRAIVLAISP